MRKVRRALLPLLLLVIVGRHAQAATEPVAEDTNVVQDVRQGASFTFKIHPGLAPRTFKLIGDPESNTIKTIEIYVSSATRPSQVLKAQQDEAPYRGADYFKMVDIDFDGYQDIGLLSWWGATGNEGWTFWRFDPASQQFVKAPEVSALGGPQFDSQARTIRSFSKAGWCEYTTTIYRYEQGKLRPIGGTKCEPPSERQSGRSSCECTTFSGHGV